MNVKIVILVILAMFVSAGCVSVSNDDFGDDSNNVSGSEISGIENSNSGVQHIATLGKGFTNTVVTLGASDRIVLVDTKSISEMPEGSEYETVAIDFPEISAKLDVLKRDGKWNKETDLLITYDYSSYKTGIKSLRDAGHQVLAINPQTYSDTVEYVDVVETAIGTSHKVSESMKKTMDNIKTTMGSYTGEKVSAVYISCTSGIMKIGNTGLAPSMIEICNATNVGRDTDKKNNYEPPEGVGAFLTQKISNGLSVILLDGNYLGTELCRNHRTSYEPILTLQIQDAPHVVGYRPTHELRPLRDVQT